MAKAATNRAYSPADNQYPKMLYKGAETVLATNAEEEAEKVKAGWATTRPANVRAVQPTRHGSSNAPANPLAAKEQADLAALVGKLSGAVTTMGEDLRKALDHVATLTETATAQEARIVALEQAAADAKAAGKPDKGK